MDEYRFSSDRVAATVRAQGSELISIDHARFGEMLWQAEPIWPQHAPNLFPIIGQLTDDTLHHAGKSYPLTRHGFARRSRFTWVDRRTDGCTLELVDDEQTRTHYPFAFRLAIDFAIADAVLTVTYCVGNRGTEILPASVGAHPAFRWPLSAGIEKSAHTLEFERSEAAPIRRLQDGLLEAQSFPSPIVGRTLALHDDLFTADAIIIDRLASRSVRYRAPGTAVVDVSWDGFRELGLWSKAGAQFLCIEPWYGYASPVGFDGDFAAKPGLLLLSAGESESLTMRIGISAPTD